MSLRPLHDRVVVKRIEEEEKTQGGIVIPDTAKEKPTRAEVVAVGEGKLLKDGRVRPVEVKPGDRVLFGKYAGTEFEMDGTDYVVMREDDIMAVLQS